MAKNFDNRKSRREQENFNSNELTNNGNDPISKKSYSKKNDNKISLRFSLANESYKWLIIFRYANSNIIPSFQDFIESEITHYFCAFYTKQKLSLFRDIYVKKRNLLEQKMMKKKKNIEDFLFVKPPESNVTFGETSVTIKIQLCRKCYYWLKAFCDLAQIDFHTFFSREINAYFRSYLSDKVRTFRDAFLELITEVDRIAKESNNARLREEKRSEEK